VAPSSIPITDKMGRPDVRAEGIDVCIAPLTDATERQIGTAEFAIDRREGLFTSLGGLSWKGFGFRPTTTLESIPGQPGFAAIAGKISDALPAQAIPVRRRRNASTAGTAVFGGGAAARDLAAGTGTSRRLPILHLVCICFLGNGTARVSRSRPISPLLLTLWARYGAGVS
jgi:hypothetical protein